MDVLLILTPTPNPLTQSLRKVAGVLPLGLGYIGAVLLEHGFSVTMVDLFNSPRPPPEIRALLREQRPRVVGLSCTTENSSNALRIARIVKELEPSTLVVVGGPHATFTADEILAEPAVDVVVRREGEFAMLELAMFHVRNLGSIDRIRGISYRDDGERARHALPRRFIENLDELPFPARHLLAGERYATPQVPFITSRGCPERCIFCSASAMAGGRYRMRSARSVVDEIRFLGAHGFRRLNFSDDTMTADTDRLVTICDYLEDLKSGLDWICESRVDAVDPPLLERMKRLGCSKIQFGVESGAQEILDAIRKHITLEMVVAAVRSARTAGIPAIVCSFMLGLPMEDEHTIRQSIRFAVALESEFGVEVRFHICTPYPGTHVNRHARELGVQLQTASYEDFNYFTPVFDTGRLTRSAIRSLFLEAQQEVLANLPPALRISYSAYQSRLASGARE